MAATLFADPPEASMDEAKDHFMAAEDLKPDGWKENRQFLAKSFIHLKDYNAALHWLDKANELPVKNPDVSWHTNPKVVFVYLKFNFDKTSDLSFLFQDQQAQNDIDELLLQYQSYR